MAVSKAFCLVFMRLQCMDNGSFHVSSFLSDGPLGQAVAGHFLGFPGSFPFEGFAGIDESLVGE